MDALKGIGHACGHNLIGISGMSSRFHPSGSYLLGIIGVGVALAIRAALEKHNIPGKIVLLGTPGEDLFLRNSGHIYGIENR